MSKPSQNTTLLILATLVLVLGLAAGNADADTIHVCWDGSGDYETIQEGIDAAQDGDEVVVCDGVYIGPGNKNLDFAGKAITVRSANGPDNCIIDCENEFPSRGFYFHSGETRASLLQGLTITNAHAVDGAGIYCDHSSPTIADCTIVANVAMFMGGGGGGVGCKNNSSPAITECRVTENWAGLFGGGIYSEASSPNITDCTIMGNRADEGGGILVLYGHAIIANCTITRNMADG